MYEIFEKLLNERGLKAADVARGTGLSSTFFTEWKKGKSKNPNPVNLQKIADYFNVSVDYLMTGKEHEFSVEMADIDAELIMLDKTIKEYALKLAKLPKEKRKHIMESIDMLQ